MTKNEKRAKSWPCPICFEDAMTSGSELTLHLMTHSLLQVASALTVIVSRCHDRLEDVLTDELDVVEDDIVQETEEKDKKKKSDRPQKLSLKKPPTCDVCGKTFASNGNLNKHKVLHNEEKPFGCDECPQKFNQQRDLKTHKMQKHTGERPHQCKICGKGFVHKSYLTEHMDYHTGDKKFQCFKCGKKFSSASNLAKHVPRHQSSRDFNCPQCHKSFVVKIDLMAHVKFVHAENGRDRSKPVFRPKSGFHRTSIPPNYEPIKEEPRHSGRNHYQKPRPAYRMIKSGKRKKKVKTPKPTVNPEPEVFQDLASPPRFAPDEDQKEMESQRNIEEWMIAQGLSLGPSIEGGQEEMCSSSNLVTAMPIRIPNPVMTLPPTAQDLQDERSYMSSQVTVPIPPFTTFKKSVENIDFMLTTPGASNEVSVQRDAT